MTLVKGCALEFSRRTAGARLATSELTVKEMNSNNGIEVLLNKMGCIFQQDNN